MIAGHPHTVRDSHVPFYMQGFPLLGQDDFTFEDSSPVIPDQPTIEPIIAPDLGPSTAGGEVTFSDVNPLQPLLDQGFTHNEAELISSAAASGHISNAQFQSILAGNHSQDSVMNTIFGTVASVVKAAVPANKPALGPGPSPRVSTPPPVAAPPATSGASIFSSEKIIKGIPDVALIGGAALILFAAMGKR